MAGGGGGEDDSVSSEKRAPHDFALWKSHKEGEPFWESPWGKGRPGWHIECSAMAKTYLGESIDIHGGGVDIIFPHHENEVTQSEALTGKPFAKYWLHNGLVMVGKQKMSKSLGNFYTINDALKKYSPDVIRYMILSFSFNSNCNFDETNLMNSEKRLYYYYYTLRKLNYLYDKCENNEPVEQMTKVFADFKKKFQESMDDNFNSAEALASLNEVFTSINQYMDKNKKYSSKVFDEFREAIKPVQEIFSILDEDPVVFMDSYKDRVCCRNSLDRKYIEKKIEERCDARNNKDFKTADEIRAELLDKCIIIMDGPEGTDWCSN
jgi:cysteinyl-tRNA synthetase